MKIILASASPRRKELFSRICSQFEIVPSIGEENADKALPPEKYAEVLAEQKCDEVFSRYPDSIVVGCDTVVAYEDKILGKPIDEDDARKTLKMLSNKTHLVVTGVCVRSPYKKIVASEVTEVRFNALSDEFIEKYIATRSPMDKAGSYGIQDEGVVRSHYGSCTNVVGLPVSLVKELINKVKHGE